MARIIPILRSSDAVAVLFVLSTMFGEASLCQEVEGIIRCRSENRAELDKSAPTIELLFKKYFGLE